MPQWRICKYDPSRRDRSGRYTVDEWTCVSQLGQSFRGVLFDLPQYLSVEAAYIESAMAFVCETGVSEVVVRDFEPLSEPIAIARPWLEEHALLEAMPMVDSMREGLVLPVADMPTAISAVLRGMVWFTLEQTNRLYLEIGSDYYLYVGSDCACARSIADTRGKGLFVQEIKPWQYRARMDWPSP